ncbi:MAG: hypothetical protein AB7N76_16240 [Planctomycetota bacterium]
MSSNVGTPVEHRTDLRPEDWEDPEPKVTGYFVVWGFILLFASIIALQFVSYDFHLSEQSKKGGAGATEGDLKSEAQRRTGLDPRAFKAEQLQRLTAPQQGGMALEAAMKKVIQEKS